MADPVAVATTVTAVPVPTGSAPVVINSADQLKLIDPNAALVTVFGYHINLATLLIALIVIGVVYWIWKIQRSTPLDFADMITMDGKKVSTTKCLQLLGGLASTWFILKTGLNGTLSEGIFGIYLTFIASIEGFSKFMSAKYNYTETSITAATKKDDNDGDSGGDNNSDENSDVQKTLKDAANKAGSAAVAAKDAQNSVRDAVQELK